MKSPSGIGSEHYQEKIAGQKPDVSVGFSHLKHFEGETGVWNIWVINAGWMLELVGFVDTEGC